jgi:hypothetical protein
LIADISAANTAGGANTITLISPTTSPYAWRLGSKRQNCFTWSAKGDEPMKPHNHLYCILMTATLFVTALFIGYFLPHPTARQGKLIAPMSDVEITSKLKNVSVEEILEALGEPDEEYSFSSFNRFVYHNHVYFQNTGKPAKTYFDFRDGKALGVVFADRPE